MDAWDQNSNTWNLLPRRPLFDREQISWNTIITSSFPVPSQARGSDCIFWPTSKDDSFTVKLMKAKLANHRSTSQSTISLSDVYAKIWVSPFPKKCRFFLWCIMYIGLNINDKLQIRFLARLFRSKLVYSMQARQIIFGSFISTLSLLNIFMALFI